MADILTADERSKNMAAIRSKDTKPEIYIRKKLFSLGYRYRKNYSGLPGHPDIYLAKYKTAIFVHGCFWHRHEGCRYAYIPKSNIDFWNRKFHDNLRRDLAIKDELQKSGIKCLIIWECTIKQMMKSKNAEAEFINKICAFMNSDRIYEEL